MLEKEANWIVAELERIGVELSPVLNVGSSTLYFRTIMQPFIQEQIIAPFERAGGQFLHLDMKQDEGVDLAGDLMEPVFREKVKALQIRGVLCSNLLEHVSLLEEIVQPGGYIILTVPYRYPYHSDPIDTMFRPEVSDLAQMLPGCDPVRGEIVTIGNTSFFRMLIRNPKLLAITTLRALLPFYKFARGNTLLRIFHSRLSLSR